MNDSWIIKAIRVNPSESKPSASVSKCGHNKTSRKFLQASKGKESILFRGGIMKKLIGGVNVTYEGEKCRVSRGTISIVLQPQSGLRQGFIHSCYRCCFYLEDLEASMKYILLKHLDCAVDTCLFSYRVPNGSSVQFQHQVKIVSCQSSFNTNI